MESSHPRVGWRLMNQHRTKGGREKRGHRSTVGRRLRESKRRSKEPGQVSLTSRRAITVTVAIGSDASPCIHPQSPSTPTTESAFIMSISICHVHIHCIFQNYPRIITVLIMRYPNVSYERSTRLAPTAAILHCKILHLLHPPHILIRGRRHRR
jgi:hypothetical protein